MISRRNLLAGLSLLPMAGGLASCSARAMAINSQTPPPPSGGSSSSQSGGSSAAGAPPAVGPGARWNGTPLSGGTPPVDPVRTTAKPAVQWWQPSELRVSSDVVIGVDADALGGVAYVDFWVEGTVQRVTQSLYVDTDVNGNARKRLGYWITLNSAALKAVSTTGSARIFAVAHPNDGTMQDRVIGYDAAQPGSASGTDGNRQMIVYPRATASDFAKTVGPSGADYTTLNAAIAAAKAANAEAAELTITASGFYELSTVAGARYSGAKGFHVVKAAPGVTATIGRATFPTGNTGTWYIEPLFDAMEFRGAGIVLDFHNFTTIGNNFASRGHRFNGCTITNSSGTRDSLYWNRGPGAQQGNPVPGYVEDCTISFVSFQIYQHMAVGNKTHGVEGHAWTGTHFAANNYVHSLDAGYFRTSILAMEIAYTGAGTATISKTGSSDSGSGNGGASGGKLVLSVNGSIVRSYTLGQIASDQWFDIQAICNDINGNAAGWTATFRDNSRRASALLGKDDAGAGFGSTNGFTNQPISSTPLKLFTWFDHHCDVVQFRTDDGAGIRENMIHRACVVVGIADGPFGNHGTKTLLVDSNLHDVIITDCVYTSPDASASSALGAHTYSHLYIRNVTHEAPTSLAAAPTDGYCRVEQTVLGQIGWATTSGPTPFKFKDCYIAYGFQGPNAWNASPNSGNTLLSATNSTTFHLGTLVASALTGDFRPLALMPVKPSVSPYDALLNPRRENDAIGAWSLGAALPTYLF